MLSSLLTTLYGEERARELGSRVEAMLSAHRARRRPIRRWDERDAFLITYPDQFRAAGETPLATLTRFHRAHLREALNGVHVLPFFPSTSDDGFSVADHRAVDPGFGSWRDIEALGKETRLMVDAVVNHCSARGAWFQAWRDGDADFAGFFRTSDPTQDLSTVVRAREHPLLTEFETVRGTEWVWTTFSTDQVDLDYRTGDVLLRVLGVLLDYAAHGAAAIRLDAVGFLWKEEGTGSIHLPQTHRIVQFLRACLDDAYPGVVLITETNVPHAENVSYFGSGSLPEADAVYQFPLPPLTLHAFTTGDATTIRRWITDTAPPPSDTTFLNFLGSHDGVGLRPLEGIVAPSEVDLLVSVTETNGGNVSWRVGPDGFVSPYELNATWYDLIRGPTEGADALARHMASHAVMLAARGIPLLYVHSLFADGNDFDSAAAGGSPRSINRGRCIDVAALETRLADSSSLPARALSGMREMLSWRLSSPAFHPDAAQRLVATPASVIGIERESAAGARARVYVNVSGAPIDIAVGTGGEARGARFERSGTMLRLGPWGHTTVLAYK